MDYSKYATFEDMCLSTENMNSFGKIDYSSAEKYYTFNIGVDFDEDKLKIGDEIDKSVCSVCFGKFNHQLKTKKSVDYPELKEVDFITAHTKCKNLIKTIEEQNKKMLDLEFELFALKFNSSKY